MDQNQKTSVTETPIAEAIMPVKNVVGDTIKKVAAYLVVAVVCLIVLNMVIKNLVSDETADKLNKVDNKISLIDSSVNSSLDSMRNEQRFFQDRMYTIESRQLQFRNKIDMNSRAITRLSAEQLKLKRIYNEKIRTVDGYSASQLDSFFSNRYNHKK